jgi:hypothetical protein
MGRPHTLDQNPDLVQELAQLLAEGVPMKDIEATLGISKFTRQEWMKREDVRRAWTKLIQDRANRVRSKTDTKILKILESDKELSVTQLLAIRDSFAADVPADAGDGGGVEVITRVMEAAAKDPVLARRLQGVLSDDQSGD